MEKKEERLEQNADLKVEQNKKVTKRVLAILLTVIFVIILILEFYFAMMLVVPFISMMLFDFVTTASPESDAAYMIMWEMPCIFLMVVGGIAEWKLIVFVVKKLARMCKNAFRKEHIEDECTAESEVD